MQVKTFYEKFCQKVLVRTFFGKVGPKHYVETDCISYCVDISHMNDKVNILNLRVSLLILRKNLLETRTKEHVPQSTKLVSI